MPRSPGSTVKLGVGGKAEEGAGGAAADRECSVGMLPGAVLPEFGTPSRALYTLSPRWPPWAGTGLSITLRFGDG